MALVRTPRESWVEEGLRALAGGGPDAVRVESLARALGVTKGGFYWHFDDRSTLLAEMLDAWERIAVDEAIRQVDATPGGGREKLMRLFGLASSSGQLLKVELAVRDWARRDKAVARRLKRVDNRRMDYMRALFGDFCTDDADIESRCLVAMCLFIGSNFVVADHRGRSRADVFAGAVRRLVQ